MPYKVILHVYDLTRGMARQMSASLLGRQIEGVWHTGVYVYGKEYFFGGGIQAIHPSYIIGTYGQPVQTLELGETEIPPEEFQNFIQDVSPRFTAATYNLLTHNCNNFSNEVANFLLGSGIPQHILDLPNEVLSTPMGAMFRPMIEEMQASMARSIQSQGESMPSISSPPFPTVSQAAPQVRTLASYDKPIVSHDVAQHFPLILRRAQEIAPFNPTQQAAFDRLATWWAFILNLLEKASPSANFNALCILRVVLVAEVALKDLTPVHETNSVIDLIVDRCENSQTLPSAHRILFLSVFVNGLVATSTAPLLRQHILRILPFVWSTWHATTVPSSHGAVAAAVVFNLSRHANPETTDEIAQLTLVGGYAEVLDLYTNGSQEIQAIERLIAGLGILLRQCSTTKSLAAEVGLVHVLSRLKVSSAPYRALATEVLSLI